jgi:phenylacetate-CoA ligase
LLERSQWLSGEELHRIQVAALNDVLAAAREIPFHRARLEAAGIGPAGVRSVDELAALPPLERTDLQRIGSDGLRRSGGIVIRRRTSGTTGEPVEVLWPLETMAWVDATERRSQEWLGVRMGDRRAYVQGRPWNRSVGRRLKRWSRNSVQFDLGQLDDPASRAALLDGLARQPPAMLVGNSPTIAKLAVELGEAHGIEPGIVVTSGAPLHEHYREQIERAFGCPIYERYGTIETGLVSHPCREGGLQHVPAESLIVEVVRDDGTWAPAGELGDVLVTCLRNRTMPLLRYRLGDTASLADAPCSCGRGLPVLERLAGRRLDGLLRPDGEIVLPETVVRSVLAAARTSLLEFKLVQDPDLSVELVVVQRDHPDPEAARRRLAHTFDELLGRPGATEVRRVPALPTERAEKLRVVVSHAIGQNISAAAP